MERWRARQETTREYSDVRQKSAQAPWERLSSKSPTAPGQQEGEDTQSRGLHRGSKRSSAESTVNCKGRRGRAERAGLQGERGRPGVCGAAPAPGPSPAASSPAQAPPRPPGAPASVAFLKGHVLRTRGRGQEQRTRAGPSRSCTKSRSFDFRAMAAEPAQREQGPVDLRARTT